MSSEDSWTTELARIQCAQLLTADFTNEGFVLAHVACHWGGMKGLEHKHVEATGYDNDNEGSVKPSGRGVRQAKVVVRPEHAIGLDGLTILCWEGSGFYCGPLGDGGALRSFDNSRFVHESASYSWSQVSLEGNGEAI